MKTRNILISLLAITCLVGCSKTSKTDKSSENSQSSASESSQVSSTESQPASTSSSEVVSSSEASTSSEAPKDQSLCVIEDFGIARLEAENFKLDDWVEDNSYDDKVVEEKKASGGKYLAAADKEDTTSEAKFSFELKKFSTVVVSVAYAQMEADKATAIDVSKAYKYSIESVSPLAFDAGKETLQARASATAWEQLTYQPQDLYPGVYNVTLSVEEDAPACPSIDFVQFKTTDASYVPADPSNITEADIPDNDMRNLQQYKYVVEEDVYKYKTYATGADLSAPRGMKLKYDDVETASTYYVQVAESEAGLDEAVVRESTEKFYYFQNAKLDTKYYYRAATSEAGLASAEVKNITSTAQAPRVVYVPDVLNFRDIGGWGTELVPGAKINQGLYFRCAQLDAASGSTTSKLDTTGKGVAALKELGIKCDIDMRDSYNQPNRGSGPSKASTTEWPVTFVSAAVASGTESTRWEGGSASDRSIAQQYVKIFNAIANCDNEPCMLHCTYGADRTGIVTFFLESLLGMSQEDMTKDYLWTQFTQGRNVKILESEGAEFPQWIKKTNALEGTSFADKMENHLISFGIEKETLEHIREIFIPGYVAQA